MSHAHADMLPKGTLVLAGLLVGFALTVTTVARITGMQPAASPAIERMEAHVVPVTSRQLRFTDRADGAVMVEDVVRHTVIEAVAPAAESGFIRGVMRGLARDRHMRGLGSEAPFTLTLWRDGALSLTDTATKRSIELGAFGSTNRAQFMRLLK